MPKISFAVVTAAMMSSLPLALRRNCFGRGTVSRPSTAADDQQGRRNVDTSHMKLSPFTRLRSKPVHEAPRAAHASW
jgi:hypothetical protein